MEAFKALKEDNKRLEEENQILLECINYGLLKLTQSVKKIKTVEKINERIQKRILFRSK